MGYRIVGEVIDDFTKIMFKKKPLRSKVFKTQEEALKYAYAMVYRKDGNTKRVKNVLTNFYVETVPGRSR